MIIALSGLLGSMGDTVKSERLIENDATNVVTPTRAIAERDMKICQYLLVPILRCFMSGSIRVSSSTFSLSGVSRSSNGCDS
jgi:hypothetical protein